jgi:hypothetical protein
MAALPLGERRQEVAAALHLAGILSDAEARTTVP